MKTTTIDVDPIIAADDNYVKHIKSKLAEIEKLDLAAIEVIGIMDSKL